MSCRLTARTTLKPISITIRWLYAPNSRLSMSDASGMSSRSRTGRGPLLLRVDHHAARRGGASAAVSWGRMSDLFNAMPAKEPGGFHEEDGDEDDERDAVLVLRAAGHIADDHHFDKPERKAA